MLPDFHGNPSNLQGRERSTARKRYGGWRMPSVHSTRRRDHYVHRNPETTNDPNIHNMLTNILNIDKEIQIIRDERERLYHQIQNCTNCLIELELHRAQNNAKLQHNEQ